MGAFFDLPLHENMLKFFKMKNQSNFEGSTYLYEEPPFTFVITPTFLNVKL